MKDSKGNECIANMSTKLDLEPICVNVVDLKTGYARCLCCLTFAEGGRADHVAVYGDVTSGHFYVFAAIKGTNKIVRWNITDDVYTTEMCLLKSFYPTNVTALGTAPIVIPITENDLSSILPKDVDAFIINPLNVYDFPKEVIDYLKSFDVPVFMSLQGFLRYPFEKIDDDNYSLSLRLTPEVTDLICDIEGLFLDESEAEILFENFDFKDININEIIVTNGSKGSRVLADKEYKIPAVECDNIVDSTGCGDTYAAAYISKKLITNSILKSANFASKIASDKLRFFGPFKGYNENTGRVKLYL